MNKNDLINGKEIELSSADHTLSFWYEQITSWDSPFKIMFNGQLYTYKSFAAASKKVAQLTQKYDLVGA